VHPATFVAVFLTKSNSSFRAWRSVKISWGLNVFARFQSDGYEDVRFPTSPYQFSVQLLKYTGRENDKGLEENAPVQGPAVPPALPHNSSAPGRNYWGRKYRINTANNRIGAAARGGGVAAAVGRKMAAPAASRSASVFAN
jgi:hypothetical protein